jgi:hypothetical protein
MPRIGLALVLTFSLVLASLVAEGQRAGKVYRLGYLSSQTRRRGLRSASSSGRRSH